MRKYSKSATRMKTMLIKIQDMRGQSPSEGGMLPLALLFKLNRKLTVLAGANIDQEQLMTAVDPFTL